MITVLYNYLSNLLGIERKMARPNETYHILAEYVGQ